MDKHDRALEAVRKGQMSARIRDEAEAMIVAQEEQTINSVMQILGKNETLEPQFAIQQWLALYSARKFRRKLLQDEKRAESASREAIPSRLTPDE